MSVRRLRPSQATFRATLVLGALVLGCGSDGTGPDNGEPPPPGLGLAFDTVVSGLESPVHLGAPAGDPRLFIVEQAGRIRVMEGGTLNAAPFLDITPRVLDGGERGLLSVAFHPDFATSGFLYVYYTRGNGDIVLERYTAAAGASTVDTTTSKLLLVVPHSQYSNHNGGLLAFGPDGMLYAGTGDGGGGGDPLGSGQSLTTLLGKLLRIDVDHGDPYAIPADNPFAGRADARGEIWAYGLRNPWRWAFDPPSGRLYIADVGQNAREEIDIASASAGGLNYGWNVLEGTACYNATTCARTGKVAPVLDYPHSDGCSITGGYVYRGTAIPELDGNYFYADYCNGWVRSFRWDGTAARDARQWSPPGDLGNVLSFGRDAAGELYVLTAGGTVLKIVKAQVR